MSHRIHPESFRPPEQYQADPPLLRAKAVPLNLSLNESLGSTSDYRPPQSSQPVFEVQEELPVCLARPANLGLCPTRLISGLPTSRYRVLFAKSHGIHPSPPHPLKNPPPRYVAPPPLFSVARVSVANSATPFPPSESESGRWHIAGWCLRRGKLTPIAPDFSVWQSPTANFLQIERAWESANVASHSLRFLAHSAPVRPRHPMRAPNPDSQTHLNSELGSAHIAWISLNPLQGSTRESL